MKAWIRTSMAATLAATLGAAIPAAFAAAGPDDCDAHHGMSGKMHQMNAGEIGERATQRLAQLQAALALKPDQMAAWDQFKGVMQDKARKAAEHMQAMHSEEHPKTALERMERMEGFARERMAAMEDVRKATQAFYGRLDATQKKTFDEQFHLFGPGRMERTAQHGHQMNGQPAVRQGGAQ